MGGLSQLASLELLKIGKAATHNAMAVAWSRRRRPGGNLIPPGRTQLQVVSIIEQYVFITITYYKFTITGGPSPQPLPQGGRGN